MEFEKLGLGDGLGTTEKKNPSSRQGRHQIWGLRIAFQHSKRSAKLPHKGMMHWDQCCFCYCLTIFGSIGKYITQYLLLPPNTFSTSFFSRNLGKTAREPMENSAGETSGPTFLRPTTKSALSATTSRGTLLGVFVQPRN